ncbi:MAG TPA: hypothetical protein VFF36_14275, partial [Planctomycetota bacterium]|nr:hypothetical protein [Planctomycetota bacterium]
VIPELLDSPARAAEIQARLSRAVRGEVRWNAFALRILPAPHATLQGLRVETTSATLAADDVTVALALWPLLRGRAEITEVRLARPALRLAIVPGAAVPEEARVEPERDPLQGYRFAMEGLIDALQEFAPDTEVAIDGASVDLTVEGMPPMALSNLALSARTDAAGVKLDASASSRYWSSMKLSGRIEYATLASAAELHLVRVRGEAWLDWLLKGSGVGVAVPDADLSLRFRAEAKKALELDLDGKAPTVTVTRGARRVAASPLVLKGRASANAVELGLRLDTLQAGTTRLAGGSLRYVLKEGALSGDAGYALDLAQALGYAREFAPGPLARIESARGALQGRASLALRGEDRRFGLTVDKSNAMLEVKDLPGPFRLARGRVELDPRAVKVDGAAASSPAGEVVLTQASYLLASGNLAADAQFDLDLAQSLALVRAAMPAQSRASLDVVESSSGRLRGGVKVELSG